jgi:adenylosuccinate synthase
MAIRINGVNKLILNKTDILDELESWTLYNEDTMYEFKNGEDFQYWIETKAKEVNPEIQTTFSSSKYAI